MTETTTGHHHFNGPDVVYQPKVRVKPDPAKSAESIAGQAVRKFLEKRERGIIGS